MQVELRYLHTPDVVDDLSVYAPQENDNFSILIEMVVGPKGKDGEEVFDFILCTPKWLMNKHGKEDIIWGRHYIIVFEYNYLTHIAAHRDKSILLSMSCDF